MAFRMKLSVIIVNYNVLPFLRQCLDSLSRALERVEAGSCEVFIVDNASSDGSRRWLSDLQAQSAVLAGQTPLHIILNDGNPGFAKANNQAIRPSSGEYVLLLNPDTVLPEDALEKSISFMDAHPRCGGLGVHMCDAEGHFLKESKRGFPTPAVAFFKLSGLAALFPKSKVFARYYLGHLDEFETDEVEILAGAYMMLRREALDAVGLLDERFFMYGEDIDLSWRLIEGGWRNAYLAEVRILHYKGESTKKGNLNYLRIFYKAMLQFARKHYHGHFLWLYTLLIYGGIIVRSSLDALCLPFVRLRKRPDSAPLPQFDDPSGAFAEEIAKLSS